MRKCYIFDIDGTLADPSHRLPHIQKQPKDWDAFFADCVSDKPIPHIVELAKTMYWADYICLDEDMGTYGWGDGFPAVVFVSGRPERIRVHTLAWLEAHGLNDETNPATLYMRSDGDRRDDTIVKQELLQKLRDDGYDPIMVFDDRDRVVQMWRDNGIPCAQVAPGNF